MTTVPYSAEKLYRPYQRMIHVMYAVMLRDMRNRFFNHGLGFLVVSIWPLVHLLVLLALATFTGRQAPYGEDISLFLTTGLIPTLAFMYVSRFMAMSLGQNRPMMAFPAVHTMDILFARAFLETIAAIITLAAVLLILYILGTNIEPQDLVQAVAAYCATILLSIGVGTVVGVISICFEFFLTIYMISMIVVYISSGTVYSLSSMPSGIAEALSWLPYVQCVEWMRSAYYQNYNSQYLDKNYLLIFGLSSLGLGLLLERLLRGRIME